MSDALRAASRAADGAGRLTGDRVRSGRAEHPVCGDELEVDVLLGDGRIEDLAWRAHGCPATLAVAACLRPACLGTTPAEVPARIASRVAELGGLATHERHALDLGARAVAMAIGAGT